MHERGYVKSDVKVKEVQANGDKVIPTVGDNARGQINRILQNPEARTQLLRNLMRLVRKNNYDGLDLNFELGDPAGQKDYARFVNQLARRLHQQGKVLSVTLKAARNRVEEGREMFDYRALGRSEADRFKVMMYDHNFDAGADVPGPIAEMKWVRSSLRYMLRRGLPAHKIHLGLHNYAWTWQQRPDKSYQLLFPHSTWSAVHEQVPTLQWDSQAAESYVNYSVKGDNFISYVGDVRTVKRRLALVKDFGLAGVVFWTLGREDPAIYSLF